MAFATIHYFSRSLRKASSFNIIFPEDPAIPRPWAAFYLLHGLSDDHTIWTRRTSIERYVEGWPLVVVMPDGGRGWYTNAIEGDAYEDDLLKDVIGLVERTFPVKAERSGRAIGGLSMGGYGAVKLGLKHPEMFASVNSHSGALGFLPESVKRYKEFSPEFERIFGKSPAGGPEDPFAISATDRPRPHPQAEDRLRHGGFPVRPESGVPSAPGVAPHPARVPGVPRRPRLGLLGQACPGGDRIPREELAIEATWEDKIVKLNGSPLVGLRNASTPDASRIFHVDLDVNRSVRHRSTGTEDCDVTPYLWESANPMRILRIVVVVLIAAVLARESRMSGSQPAGTGRLEDP